MLTISQQAANMEQKNLNMQIMEVTGVDNTAVY